MLLVEVEETVLAKGCVARLTGPLRVECRFLAGDAVRLNVSQSVPQIRSHFFPEFVTAFELLLDVSDRIERSIVVDDTRSQCVLDDFGSVTVVGVRD